MLKRATKPKTVNHTNRSYKANMASTENHGRAPRGVGRWQRGQSLVEVAFSLTFLILIFSGAVDLGRAYYTRLTMDSAISEGTHWMAAYPGCFLYGAAFGSMDNVVNAPGSCRGTNSIFQRIENESSLLAPSMIQNIYLKPPTGKLASQVVPSDTVTVGMTYQMPLLTPVMRAMFNNNLTLTVEGKEVIRGTTLPPTSGKYNLTYNPISTLEMPQYLTQTDGTSSACNKGFAPLQWTQPASTSTLSSFEVWIVDGGSASLVPATGSPNGYLANPAAVSASHVFTIFPAPGSPWSVPTTPTSPISYQIDLTTGGSIMYGVRTKDTSGKYSDFEYIVLTCPKVQPSSFSYTCAAGTPSPSVTFNWTMPSRSAYTWSPSRPTDKSVDGFAIVNASTGAPLTSLSPGIAPTGNSGTTTTTYNFTGPTDTNRSANFYIVSLDNASSAPVGLDNSGNSISVSGGVYSRTNSSGTVDTTSDISVTCP